MQWLLLLWIVSAALSAYVATRKNRNAMGWFLLGLALGPFALLALLFLEDLSPPPPAFMSPPIEPPAAPPNTIAAPSGPVRWREDIAPAEPQDAASQAGVLYGQGQQADDAPTVLPEDELRYRAHQYPFSPAHALRDQIDMAALLPMPHEAAISVIKRAIFEGRYEWAHKALKALMDRIDSWTFQEKEAFDDLIAALVKHDPLFRDHIVPIVRIVRNYDGMPQREIYANFPESSKSEVLFALRVAETLGLIERRPSGRSRTLHRIENIAAADVWRRHEQP